MMKEIEWGTNIKDLPDMVFMKVIEHGKKVYTREGEKMKIGDADTARVAYGFHHDRLYEVQIHFRSFFNFLKLKEKLFKLYGPGRQPSGFLETYHWNGKETSVFLTYDENSGKGAIGYTFLPIYKERQEDRKLEEVSSWLASLTDMERRVITLRFGFNGEDPLTLESIGERLGLVPEKIHQIGAEAIEKLRRISKKEEIDSGDVL